MSTTDQFYVWAYEQQQGPYTKEELRNRIACGTMSTDTLIWHEGLSGWVSFSDYIATLELTANTKEMPPPLHKHDSDVTNLSVNTNNKKSARIEVRHVAAVFSVILIIIIYSFLQFYTGIGGAIFILIYFTVMRSIWRAIMDNKRLAIPITALNLGIFILLLVCCFAGWRYYEIRQDRIDKLRPYLLQVEMHPNFSFPLVRLGFQYLYYEETSKAEECAKKAIQLADHDTSKKSAYELLAKVYRKKNQIKEAESIESAIQDIKAKSATTGSASGP